MTMRGLSVGWYASAMNSTLRKVWLVIAVLGVTSCNRLDGAKVSTAQTDLKAIHAALDVFFVSKARYPEASEGLRVLVEQRMLKELPVDPWGTPYQYTLEGGKPVVTSLGSDKAPGGSGSAADVSNSMP